MGNKIIKVSDTLNGFVCGCDVYCGKNETSCANNATVLDPPVHTNNKNSSRPP